MSSTYFTTDDNVTMIERLLAEVRIGRPERSFDIVANQARLLAHAMETGISVESDLRSLLAEYVELNNALNHSSRRAEVEAGALSHRQEHMLPSPDEEFNAATAIHPMTVAPRDGRSLIGRNTVGETAMIHWIKGGASDAHRGHWVRLDTGEPFDAEYWVRTTWTVIETLDHSGTRPDKMSPTPSTCVRFKALDALRRIFPDLEVSDADLVDAITSEALVAGRDIDFDIPAALETRKREALERWDSEGGSSGTEAQR